MNRRTLFRWMSLVLTGCFATFLAVPGIGMLIEPLRRQAKKEKRRRLLKLSDLEIGVPRKFVIRDRRTDAWTRYPDGVTHQKGRSPQACVEVPIRSPGLGPSEKYFTPLSARAGM